MEKGDNLTDWSSIVEKLLSFEIRFVKIFLIADFVGKAKGAEQFMQGVKFD